MQVQNFEELSMSERKNAIEDADSDSRFSILKGKRVSLGQFPSPHWKGERKREKGEETNALSASGRKEAKRVPRTATEKKNEKVCGEYNGSDYELC